MLKKLFLLILLPLLSLNVFAHGNEWIGSAIIKDAKWSFSAKFKDLPKNIPITVEKGNSDFEVGYRIEKIIKNGNTIWHISDFTTLFTVRRDTETDLWFETISWKDIDKKTPAVTIYKSACCF